MVVLAAAVCNKSGRALLSRQFVDMTRPRIEGLLVAFPKLGLENTDPDKQHTFIETDTVRYVYQPMEDLFMVLITSRTSNIVEDLDTLHLFAKLVSTFCQHLTEKAVLENCWELVFAFDEAVCMGYKEKVTVSQVKNFVEMESHEEKAYRMDLKNKEDVVRRLANQRAAEIRDLKEQQRRAELASKTGAFRSTAPAAVESNVQPVVVHSKPSQASRHTESPTRSTGMQLGSSKQPSQSAFLDQISKEGDIFADTSVPTAASVSTSAAEVTAVHSESVHIVFSEHFSVQAQNDGGLLGMEVKGELALTITDPAVAHCVIHTVNRNPDFAFKTHPQIDKGRYTKENGLVALKEASRGFPVGSVPLPVLKWRMQTKDESKLPFSISCWPGVGRNGMVVNVEYEMQSDCPAINDLSITIPIANPRAQVKVGNLEGDYRLMRGELLWHVPLVDEDNATGNMEFSVAEQLEPSSFFPINASFTFAKCLAGIEVGDVQLVAGQSVPFSTEIRYVVDCYSVESGSGD